MSSELKGLGTPDAQFQIPLKRVKKRRIVITPLSDLAQEILAETIQSKDQKFVFPGKIAGRPVSRQAPAKAVRGHANKNGKVIRGGIRHFLGMTRWTPHDLRRTAASLAYACGFDEKDIALCLDHQNSKNADAPARVTGIYVREGVFRRSRKLDKKREILDAIAKALRKIIGTNPAENRPKLAA
jgi:integrase